LGVFAANAKTTPDWGNRSMPLDGGHDNVAVAKDAGLRYVHEDDPGIRRKRAGKGFTYLDPHGHRVKDAQTLDRIRRLAIPPAYEDVWISPHAQGHIQATGRDARGRKQYRYHADWSAVRGETKFAHMAAFGRALPKIRARVEADLRKHALSHDKVVATVVSLLELTLIRVGNDQYAKDNKSFGLTTLRNRHVKSEGAALKLEFKGKSGVMHKTGLHDRRLVRIIKALQALPGQRLFQYVDEAGERHAVCSHDVNAYLHEIVGEPFTAKDFRTWAGTVAAAKALAMQPPPSGKTEAKRLTNLCVKATAGLLGNTPAVCRSAYIHPAVLEAFAEQSLPKSFAKAEGDKYEKAVLKFLDALVKAPTRRKRKPGSRKMA
jgi:DNA topoisomerase-1